MLEKQDQSATPPLKDCVQIVVKPTFVICRKKHQGFGIVRNMNKIKMWKQMFERLLSRKKAKAPRHGKWKEFNKHAVLIAEGHYQDDLKHGLWKQYYETGELLIEETYDHDVLHGKYASYHMNGALLSAGQYQHGRREGYFNVYDETGKQLKRLLFVNNVQVEEIDSTRTPAVQRETVVSR